jgi:hypothetical protein
LWDYRYFFKDDKGLGHSTCGVARDTIARALRQYGEAKFLDGSWFKALYTSRNNPSVLGFIIEQMCLTSIAQTGLCVGGRQLNPMLTSVFEGRAPPFIDMKQEVTLYVPLRFNFPAVDAVIVEVDGKKKAVLLVPLQITIADRHSDSEEKFFETWADWEGQLHGYSVRVLFVWVKEGTRSPVESIEERKKDLRRAIVGRPGYERSSITVKDVNHDVGQELERAREESTGGESVGGESAPKESARGKRAREESAPEESARGKGARGECSYGGASRRESGREESPGGESGHGKNARGKAGRERTARVKTGRGKTSRGKSAQESGGC